MRCAAVLLGIGLLVAGMPVLPGCQGDKVAGEQTDPASITGAWMLRSIEGDDVAQGLLAAGRTPTLDIASNGSVTGFGGVNRLTSSVDMAGVRRGEFRLGPIGATRMAGPAEAMQLESRYTRALGEVRRCKRDDKGLVLMPEGKGVTLRFVKAP